MHMRKTFYTLFSVVDLLIQNGADVNHELQSGQGWSALYMAAENNLTKIARMLISDGADVNKTVKSTGWTPIDIASWNGQSREIKN